MTREIIESARGRETSQISMIKVRGRERDQEGSRGRGRDQEGARGNGREWEGVGGMTNRRDC